MKDINAIVLADIRSMASLVVENEDEARQNFLAPKAVRNERQTTKEQRRLRDGRYRLEEVQELTREMCLELIEYITVDALPLTD